MTISEKAAYMKGLAEGLNLDNTTPIGKVMEKVLDLLSDLSAEVTDLREETNSLREYAEELDEDLGDVESDLWGDDDEEEDDEDDDDEDETGFYEATCPACGETVCFDDSIDPEEVVCPACGEKFSCVIDCDGDCDSCDGCDEPEEE